MNPQLWSGTASYDNQMRSSDVLPWGRLPCPAPIRPFGGNDPLATGATKGAPIQQIGESVNYVAMIVFGEPGIWFQIA